MNLSCMPQFLISNRASVAREKILEKMRGKSCSPIETECNNHSYRLTSDCSLMCTTKKFNADRNSTTRGRGPISRMGLMLQHQ